MSQRLIELHLKRGRLLERIDAQRHKLARQVVPVRVALDTADRAIDLARDSARFVRQHPGGVTALAVAAVVLRPRVVWRWLQRGFFAWRSWRAVRGFLPGLKQ
jgi:hypothetical protein